MVSIACSATVFSVISGRDCPVASRYVRMCRPVGAPGWHECKAHIGRWPWPGGSTETRWPPFPDAPRPGPWRCRAPWRACPTEPLLPMEWAKTARLARFLRAFCPLRVVVAGGVGRPLRPVEGHAVTGGYGGRTPEKTIKRAFSAHSIGRERLLVVAVPAL